MEPVTATTADLAIPAEIGLVQRAAAGDVRAFEQLVATRAERAFRVARAILGNDPDAHDATQEAFVSAWRELPRLRDPGVFDVWIRRIIVNACRANLRGRRRVREIPLDTTVEFRQPGPTIPDRVGDADLLSHAFERLDADKRALLVLHYLDHEPVAAIASALGIPVGTTKWRLSEARAALGRALAAEGEARR